ncbi:MAG: 4Fe-4S binding protein [Gracilibacteraceae bacterium]|nr:4Fe-4S binding protein [Gracilibacteraceae bacterium]
MPSLNAPQMIFHPGNCLNNLKPFSRPCQLCIQYCPHDAIDASRNIDRSKCTDCGTCMSVCPSDGMLDSGMRAVGEYLLGAEAPALHCPAAQPVGLEIPCIGVLDRDAWIALLLLSERKDVRMLTGDCGLCDDRQACAVSVTVLQNIVADWGEPLKVKIEIRPDTGAAPDAAETARSAPPPAEKDRGLKAIRAAGRRKMKEMLPGVTAAEVTAVNETRRWLINVLAEDKERRAPYLGVRIGDACTDCCVCAKICPRGALSITQREGKIIHVYESARCMQCRRCEEVCGPQTLKLDTVYLTYKYLTGKILLREGVPRYCAKCGIPIHHNKEPGLCLSCAAKDPALKGVLY